MIKKIELLINNKYIALYDNGIVDSNYSRTELQDLINSHLSSNFRQRRFILNLSDSWDNIVNFFKYSQEDILGKVVLLTNFDNIKEEYISNIPQGFLI